MVFSSVLRFVPKKNLLSPTILAPLVNNCLISQFQENVTSFNFPANAHCVKSVQIRSFFSCPYLSTFGLNTEIYSVNLRSNAGKYGQEKTPYLDTFHAVALNTLNSQINVKPRHSLVK